MLGTGVRGAAGGSRKRKAEEAPSKSGVVAGETQSDGGGQTHWRSTVWRLDCLASLWIGCWFATDCSVDEQPSWNHRGCCCDTRLGRLKAYCVRLAQRDFSGWPVCSTRRRGEHRRHWSNVRPRSRAATEMLRFLSRRKSKSDKGGLAPSSSQPRNASAPSTSAPVKPNKNILVCKIIVLDGTDLTIELHVSWRLPSSPLTLSSTLYDLAQSSLLVAIYEQVWSHFQCDTHLSHSCLYLMIQSETKFVMCFTVIEFLMCSSNHRKRPMVQSYMNRFSTPWT